MIRTATVKDVPSIAAINRAARTSAMPWLPVLHTFDGDLKFFERIVLDPVEVVDVVEIDDQVVGFMSVGGDWLEQLYIHPDHQRHCLGTAFIKRAQSGAKALQLWVFEQNTAAQNFYAVQGFEVAERTDGSNNEERCPDLRMTWSVGGLHGQS